jgi:flagellar hook-length control protein FliK
MSKITVESVLGSDLEVAFMQFDITEVQKVLAKLATTDVIDIHHAEMLQLRSLYGADILSEFLGKIVKTVSYLETKLSVAKNKTSLEYKSDEGKTTADMKKYAAECNPVVEELQIKLAQAKGTKALLEKKYDLLIKSHHYYKEIASGLRQTILGRVNPKAVPDGWDE